MARRAHSRCPSLASTAFTPRHAHAGAEGVKPPALVQGGPLELNAEPGGGLKGPDEPDQGLPAQGLPWRANSTRIRLPS